jgi:glycosyltransferase involved in cell wall biosynthesis
VEDSKHTLQRPLVSCVVPVFNGELYLRDALDSALQQTYRPLEVIVVDDGSTDATPDVLAAYANRVCCVRQANAGPAAARNCGVQAARGEFIAFLDADDLWHPEKLMRQMARFEARSDLDLCLTYAQNFWIPELRDEEARFRGHRITRPLPAYVPSTLLARCHFLDTVGPFDAALRFGHSTEWFLRAAVRDAVIEVLPEVLYYRRLHHSNRSRQLSAASRDEHFDIVKAHLDRRRRERRLAGSAAGAKK